MAYYLETSANYIHSEDEIVREFIAYNLQEYPHTPAKLVNDLL